MPDLAVEAADFVVGLATAMHRAGVPVPPERSARLAQALRLHPPSAREPLYWSARVTLVSSHDQLATFDAVFSAVFDGLLDPADARGDTNAPPAIGSEPHVRQDRPRLRPASGEVAGQGSAGPSNGPDDDRTRRDAPLGMVSTAERLGQTAFSDLDPEEVAAVRRLVQRIVLSTPLRQSRRTSPSARSRSTLDLRRTLRAARRTGGDPVRLVHRRRRARPRRLVLLCDVSASMEPYTRVFLSLLHGAVRGASAEAFVFATRLTRLTRALSVRDPDQALAHAGQVAPDWAGGTRLAENVQRFLDEHGRRGMGRGAVVVVLSDGWAQDEPEQVALQMTRLHRLAHRVVWVNPRKAAAGFAPLVGGMAAALPHCDAFVSGHSLAALEEVAAAVGSTVPRATGRLRGGPAAPVT